MVTLSRSNVGSSHVGVAISNSRKAVHAAGCSCMLYGECKDVQTEPDWTVLPQRFMALNVASNGCNRDVGCMLTPACSQTDMQPCLLSSVSIGKDINTAG